MSLRSAILMWPAISLLVIGLAATAFGQPVIVDITTHRGVDTLYTGQPGSIIFTVDANGNRVAAITFPFELVFYLGNVIGPMAYPGNVIVSAEAIARFENKAWNDGFGKGTDPDTVLFGFVDFGGTLWDISGELWRINFTPTHPGTVRFDGELIPPSGSGGIGAVDDQAQTLPVDWRGEGREIVVVDSGFPLPGPVVIRVGTTSGDDTLRPGGSIVFTVDANGLEIAAMSFPLLAYFSGENFIGPLAYGFQFDYSAQARDAFENLSFNTDYGCGFTDAPVDTLLLGVLDFNGVYWTGSGEFCRMTFAPLSTGTVRFDTSFLPAVGGISALNSGSKALRLEWISPVIHAPELFTGNGAPLTTLRMLGAWGSDTFFVGSPAAIVFFADPGRFPMGLLNMPLQFRFSNGNLIGPVRFHEEFELTALAETSFDYTAFSDTHGEAVTDPDTLFWYHESTPGPAPGLVEAGVLARLTFVPGDTGSFTIDSVFLPPGSHMSAVYASNVPCEGAAAIDWQSASFHVVPCPVALMGDVNVDGVRNSADIIHFVNYIFKSGPEPLPERSAGDVNCSGGLTGADVIYLVNYVFKGGRAPCGCFVKRI